MRHTGALGKSQFGEGIGYKKGQRSKKCRREHGDADHIGEQLPVPAPVLKDNHAAIDRHQPGPKQQRPFLARPENGKLEEKRKVAVRVRGHVAYVETVLENQDFNRYHSQRDHTQKAVGGPLGTLQEPFTSGPTRREGAHYRISGKGQRRNQHQTSNLVHKRVTRGIR